MAYLLLTFDDGPSHYMDQICAALECFDGKGTFFPIGRKIDDSTADYLRDAVMRGHELGSHGFAHHLGDHLYESVCDEVEKGLRAIKGVLPDYAVHWYRSPGIQQDAVLWSVLQEKKLPLIGGALSSRDWNEQMSGADVLERVLSAPLEDGDIITFHELEKTIGILPQLLEKLTARGFHFCTLSQYLEMRGMDYEFLPRDRIIKNMKFLQ